MKRLHWSVLTLIALIVVIELGIQVLAATGTLPAPRQIAMSAGAFWSPIARGAAGIYPGQGVVMFLTYGLLHGGLIHLAVNMLSLATIAERLYPLMGRARFWLTYLLSQIAGAATFALMEPTLRPMVGASGAIFGLAGALVAWSALQRHRRGLSQMPVFKAVALVIGINVALTLLMQGAVAWQAHLGGALAGAALGLLFGIKRAR